MVENSGSGTITKNSGPIIYSVESSETNPTVVNSLFPNTYVFEETTTDVENESVKTGYTGTITKTGTPTSTYLGQITTTDSRNESKNSDFTNEIDVTVSQEDINHKVVSPIKGASSTNPNTYNPIHYYNDGVKEGLLNYVSKGSTLVGGTYEYYANYSGPIFTIQPRNNGIAPNSIAYVSADGYTGTLYKDAASLISSLKSIRTTSTAKTVTNHKVYTPGDFASSANTQTYPATYAYSDAQKYTGNLNYGSKNSEFSFSQREGHRTENQTKTSAVDSFVNSIAYNSGGFDGTLTKNGPSYVSSGVFVPDQTRTEVDSRTSTSNTFPISLPYSNSGFTGTLAKNGVSTVISGVYTPIDTKAVTKTLSISDLDCTTDCQSFFLPTANYNVGGYTGTLNTSGSFYFTNNGGSDTDYSREFVLMTFNSLEKPTSRPTYSGSWSKVATYEMERIYVYNKIAGDYSYGTYYKGKTTTAVWESVGGQTSQGNNWTWDDYYNNRGGDITFNFNANSWRKPYYITEWKWTRNIGDISQNYSGNASKPASDTRNWQQNYSGTVTKPGSDNRVYGQNYSGEVSTVVDYYKHYAMYSGTANKLNYFALYNYNADYSGSTSKDILKDLYRYDQTYTGTLSKNVPNFNYEYQREFTGTLFKEVSNDVIEYTQTYKGTVEEIQ